MQKSIKTEFELQALLRLAEQTNGVNPSPDSECMKEILQTTTLSPKDVAQWFGQRRHALMLATRSTTAATCSTNVVRPCRLIGYM